MSAMTTLPRFSGPRRALWLRRTVRLRLIALYSALFLASSIGLLAITSLTRVFVQAVALD